MLILIALKGLSRESALFEDELKLLKALLLLLLLFADADENADADESPKISNILPSDTAAGVELRTGVLAKGSETVLDAELPKLSNSLFELLELPELDEANGSKTEAAEVDDDVENEEEDDDDTKGSKKFDDDDDGDVNK